MALNQGALDVNTYYTRHKILWDELKEFQPIPICHCGVMKSWMEYQQKECVIQFLMGLNDSYSSGQILLELLLPITKVFTLVVQEERQRSVNQRLSLSNDS